MTTLHFASTEPDNYGQVHSIETPELITAALDAIDEELSHISDPEKESYLLAVQNCPDIVLSKEHRLLFLRCEVFRVKDAAERLVIYWDTRVKLFGDKAFGPLTLNSLQEDDHVCLSLGFARIVPAKDDKGRGIILVDPSRQDREKHTREGMVRCLWYIMHALFRDDIDVQQKGVIIIGHPKHLKFQQMDREQVKMNINSIRNCLPLRISSFIICHPPTFFEIIFPFLKLIIGAKLRKRIKVCSGTDEAVLKKLAKCNLSKRVLPSDIGGDIKLNHSKWIEERKKLNV